MFTCREKAIMESGITCVRSNGEQSHPANVSVINFNGSLYAEGEKLECINGCSNGQGGALRES